ncbi:MAG: hypothetical protein GC193_03350 [Cryomorphaceae bacterium]|nr:hypothetical protein [Cryomorphaceae bacterium]
MEKDLEIISSKFLGPTSGWVILRKGNLCVKIISEHGKPFIDIGYSMEGEWFNLPIVRKLRSPESQIQYMGILEKSHFIEENFDWLMNLFEPNVSEMNRESLDAIKRQRLL